MGIQGKKKQGGFTFIEMTIAVVIIAVAMSFLAPQLKGLLDNNVTVTQEVGAMKRSFSQMTQRFIDEGVDSSFGNEEMIRGRLQSEAYQVNGTAEVFNIFKGAITVTGADDNGWKWVSEKIPADSCAILINEARTVGYESYDTGSGKKRYSQVTTDEMAVDCDAGSAGADILTVTWVKETT